MRENKLLFLRNQPFTMLSNQWRKKSFFYSVHSACLHFFLPKSKFVQRQYKQLQMQYINQTKQASFKLGTNLSKHL